MSSNRSCGACSGWISWIRPPHYNFFEEECKIHDALYDIGGDRSDRLMADQTLFRQMVRRSVGYFEEKSVLSLWWFVTLAYLYYLAVRILGRYRFKYLKYHYIDNK